MRASPLKVGMREFRAHLPQYLFAHLPVAITRHGETVGFYIPTRQQPTELEIDVLKQAVLQLEHLLLTKGIKEDELVAEFRELRARKKQ
jgi:hypothetical protein